jgi:hypothetical protein
MSRKFGDLLQIGYVVRDIEAAMLHWAEALGVGPWFYIEHLDVPDFLYHGRPSPVDLSLALAHSGMMQIELIQQRNTAPSLYQDFLVTCGDGPYHQGAQHLGYGTFNFEADLRRLRWEGYTVAQRGTGGSRGPFAYLDLVGVLWEYHPGTIIELIDLAHGRAELFAAIRDASRGWDGHDPVRRQLPL